MFSFVIFYFLPVVGIIFGNLPLCFSFFVQRKYFASACIKIITEAMFYF